MAAAHALRTTTTDLYTAKIVSTRPMFLTTGGWIMPIQIKDCDGGIGGIIASYGMLTDEELLGTLKRHLTQESVKSKMIGLSSSKGVWLDFWQVIHACQYQFDT